MIVTSVRWIWAGLAGLGALLAATTGKAAPSGGKAPSGGSGGGGRAPTPEELGARMAGILAAVRAGTAEHTWTPIALAAGGHVGEIEVSADDMRVAGVRVTVDALTLGAIAEELGGVLATSRVADLVYAQAARKVAPMTRKWYLDDSMSTIERERQYSDDVDAKFGAEPLPLAANTGKWWVQSVRLKTAKKGTAANYGWHTGQGNQVIQGVGIGHNDRHVDYSQKARIMRDTMTVDGQTMSTQDVLADPELSALLSSEGAL